MSTALRALPSQPAPVSHALAVARAGGTAKMFLWWLAGNRDQVEEKRSPREEKGKQIQAQEEDLVGLASIVRSPPSRKTPSRHETARSLKHSSARPTTRTPNSPVTSVPLSRYQQWTVVQDNHDIATDTRHALEQLAHRSDLKAAGFVVHSQTQATSSRRDATVIPGKRAAVQKKNQAIVQETRQIHALYRHCKEENAKAISQWGKVKRYGEQMQKHKINESRSEVTMLNKKAAVQAIAQRRARKELLAQEAAEALVVKQRLVHEVARQTSPETKARSMRLILSDRKEAADSVRQESDDYARKKVHEGKQLAVRARERKEELVEQHRCIDRSFENMRCAGPPRMHTQHAHSACTLSMHTQHAHSA